MKDSIKQLDPTDLEWGKVCIEFYAALMPELEGRRGGSRGGRGSVGLVEIGLILELIFVVLKLV